MEKDIATVHGGNDCITSNGLTAMLPYDPTSADSTTCTASSQNSEFTLAPQIVEGLRGMSIEEKRSTSEVHQGFVQSPNSEINHYMDFVGDRSCVVQSGNGYISSDNSTDTSLYSPLSPCYSESSTTSTATNRKSDFTFAQDPVNCHKSIHQNDLFEERNIGVERVSSLKSISSRFHGSSTKGQGTKSINGDGQSRNLYHSGTVALRNTTGSVITALIYGDENGTGVVFASDTKAINLSWDDGQDYYEKINQVGDFLLAGSGTTLLLNGVYREFRDSEDSYYLSVLEAVNRLKELHQKHATQLRTEQHNIDKDVGWGRFLMAGKEQSEAQLYVLYEKEGEFNSKKVIKSFSIGSGATFARPHITGTRPTDIDSALKLSLMGVLDAIKGKNETCGGSVDVGYILKGTNKIKILRGILNKSEAESTKKDNSYKCDIAKKRKEQEEAEEKKLNRMKYRRTENSFQIKRQTVGPLTEEEANILDEFII